MKPDKTALDEFNKLESIANNIAATHYHESDTTRLADIWVVDTHKFHEWATSSMSLLEGIFGKNTIHYQNFADQYSKFTGEESVFQKCWEILREAEFDYKVGYILHYRALVSAEVLDDALEQASVLHKAGYKDPACVIADVALETTLKLLCEKHGISYTRPDETNINLCTAGIYNIDKQEQINTLSDLGKKAAHGEWNSYNEEDVASMIKEVGRFIADYLT